MSRSERPSALRVVILGNSGSGKSTLARSLAAGRIPTLDLDTIYWEPGKIAVRRDPEAMLADLARFRSEHDGWVIEGCYGSLAEAVLVDRPKLIFLHPGKDVCLDHCRARPWEAHKYESREAQDAHLAALLDWVVDYYERDGEMSFAGHWAIFDAYDGPKEFVARLTKVTMETGAP